MNLPLIVSPPGLTTLGSRPVMGGWIRRPSLITACTYGKVLDSAEVIGEEIVPFDMAVWISETMVLYTRGVLMTWSMVARMAVAVVSDPATLNLFNGLESRRMIPTYIVVKISDSA